MILENSNLVLYFSEKSILMKMLKYFSLTILFAFMSCKNATERRSELQTIYAAIKTTYAPDKRVELFDIRFTTLNDIFILEGETTSEKAFYTLLDSLNKREIPYKNKVRILPDSIVKSQPFAVARNSVINIRSKPKHDVVLIIRRPTYYY